MSDEAMLPVDDEGEEVEVEVVVESKRPDPEPASQPTPGLRAQARHYAMALTTRWVIKVSFLGLFLYSIAQLLRFEKWANGEGPYVQRPESVAGLLPLGHFLSFFAWLRGGGWDTILPAGLVIILGAFTLSFVFKRGFCGWICPLGTVWEASSSLGRRLLGRNLRLWKWLDLIGRGLRYAIMAMLVFMLFKIPLAEALAFRELPYMKIADLKIVHAWTEPTFLMLFLFAGALSLFLGPVWCRYLCPLGGLYSLTGIASPCTIDRDDDLCIHCKKCDKVCHAFVEVEKVKRVWAPECDGCMDCVRVCPEKGALEAKAFSKFRIAPWLWPLLVVALWFSIIGGAHLMGQWRSSASDEEFKMIIQSGMVEQKTRSFGDPPTQ